MSTTTEALRVQALVYAIKIHERDLQSKNHYSVTYDGLIYCYNQGASDDETYINYDKRINNVRDGEVFGYPSVNTKSQEEAVELHRLIQLYATSKLQMCRRAPVKVTPVVTEVKSDNKRKAIIALPPPVDDEENVTASDPYFVRVYAHKARIAKAMLPVIARDVTELGIGDSSLRKAESEYTDALHALKRARTDAIEHPIVSEEAELESQNGDE